MLLNTARLHPKKPVTLVTMYKRFGTTNNHSVIHLHIAALRSIIYFPAFTVLRISPGENIMHLHTNAFGPTLYFPPVNILGILLIHSTMPVNCGIIPRAVPAHCKYDGIIPIQSIQHPQRAADRSTIYFPPFSNDGKFLHQSPTPVS